MYDLLAIVVYFRLLFAGHCNHIGIGRLFSILETVIIQGMGNDVLNFINQNKDNIRRMAEGTFSGVVSIEDRAKYLESFSQLMGWSIKVCWTCGSSMKNLGRILENKMKELGEWT